MLPTAPAAFIVWQALHVLTNTTFPALLLPTSGGVAERWASAAGTNSAAAMPTAAIPAAMLRPALVRSIGNLL
jgi:hypothetical protein